MGLDDIFTASVFASAIRLATPYIFAALGETFAQRSGVLNLGVDGIMLMGAFGGFYAVHLAQEAGVLAEPLGLLLGVLVALIVGGLMGLAMAFVSVTLKAKQGISGIGVYLFGLGLSELLFQQLVGTPKSVAGFPRISFPVLTDIPILGEIFFHHNLLVYVAFALVPISAFVLNRTTFGLMIRAVGQNPEAADAMGVSVARVRYATTTIGGMLAGLAGASLSIALINLFQQNLTAGQGFIAVALVYFGGWRPLTVAAGAMLFSFVNALQLQIKVIGADIPSEFAVMAPYVITIIALVFATKRQEQPTALTKPYERGE
ncbi:MAG: ABC transporter permease [Chloroflexi bacterium]|nr:ABC transporter permease [Chloroflexota bacterium]MCY3581008.1 ABC transporter permease [Chloroflexota bacterium]MCY3716637.1 ABC transporter permease [Chloroflexota bacterium]MDE2650500.1 ABC transporter permease [Chloroflexota bacterium]MXV92412.1 ABC transporter permease [Chloroflexota bacterium]